MACRATKEHEACVVTLYCWEELDCEAIGPRSAAAFNSEIKVGTPSFFLDHRTYRLGQELNDCLAAMRI